MASAARRASPEARPGGLAHCANHLFPAHDRAKSTAKAARESLGRLDVETSCIEPGSPWENGYDDSLDGKLRDELLNGVIVYTLTESRVLIER